MLRTTSPVRSVFAALIFLPKAFFRRSHIPLHPTLVAVLHAGRNLPAYETLSIQEVRQRARQGYIYAQTTAVSSVHNRTIAVRHGDINIRIYKPGEESTFPAVVFFHGSGFCILDLDTHDEICRELCSGAQCIVISVDYGLAPESVYPRGIDDSLDATGWVMDNASDLSIDSEKIVLAGDSAGGNIATVTALRLRDEGKLQACGLLLFYPVTDHYDAEHPSYIRFETGFGLPASTMRWFWDLYLDGSRLADQPYVSPVRADLRGLLRISAHRDRPFRYIVTDHFANA